MTYKSRGSHKKFTSKGRHRHLATDDEVIARNNALDSNGSDASDNPELTEIQEETSSDDSPENKYPYLIEVCNPNKNRQSIEKTGITELSRREREELKRQQFERQKMKLIAEGKLESAKADLKRLAEIRKAREEAKAKALEKLSQ